MNSETFYGTYNIMIRILFHIGAIAYDSAYFGEGSVEIAMNSVQCDGTESELDDCTYSTFTLFCQHDDDAGVACLPNPSKNSYIVYFVLYIVQNTP